MIRPRALFALSWSYLLETWRSKPALLWNLVLPILYIIGLSYIFGGGETARVTRIVPGIMTISLITAAFFGIALHMVSLREKGLYRRFRVTPLTALTVVLAHALTALVNILVGAGLQLLVAWLVFRVKLESSPPEVLLALLLSAFAFIPLGLLVGSVASDMKSGPAISNLIFLPMMFLSGAAVPLFLMPAWLQKASRLLPATYVVEILQAAIFRGFTPDRIATPAAILLLTGFIGFAFNAFLFRWESKEPLNRKGLLLTLVILAVVYGTAFARSVRLDSTRPPGASANRAKPGAGAQVLAGMTILDGTGGRIENGQVVIENGKIVEVLSEEDGLPEGVAVTRLPGQFLIPGLIDSHVHLGGSAGGSITSAEFAPDRVIHDLQAYLGVGVTSFLSLTDDAEDMKSLREEQKLGMMRTPRPFFSGPGLTAPGGHPAKYFRIVPGLAKRMTRQVTTAAEAEAAVRALAAVPVDLVKLFLEGGRPGEPLPVLSEAAFRAGIRTAKSLGLKTTVHVDSDQDARLAIDAGADSLEHMPSDLSDETIRLLVAKGITLTPTLTATEGLMNALNGTPLTDPLVKEWVLPEVLTTLQSPNSWLERERKAAGAVQFYTGRHADVLRATRRAVQGGVTLLAGSDAGNPEAFHGLGLIHELELLVNEAGMTPAAALTAATSTAAKRLGSTTVGRIAPGAFADLVVLGADPTRDIRALRDIRAVYLGGKSLHRDTLLTTSPGSWMPRSGVQSE